MSRSVMSKVLVIMDDASKQVIQDNPELAEELEGLIFAALKEQE